MPVANSRFPESGIPAVDHETCTRCGMCVRICPAEVLLLNGGRVEVAGAGPFGCIACGHCMMICPHGSIEVRGRGVSPLDLRSLPPRSDRASAEHLEALMAARRSVRRFLPEEVHPELLVRIVDAAATAPMAIPPWDVGCTIIAGRERVQEVAGEVVKGYDGFLRIFRPWLLRMLRPFFGRAKYEQFSTFILPLAESYVGAARSGRDLVFYDAPAVILFSHSPYAEQADAAIACTYAMLAAEALGLGTTMIGGAAPILQRNRPLCRTLGIPDDFTPALALVVGHPAIQFDRAIRRSFAFVAKVEGVERGNAAQVSEG